MQTPGSGPSFATHWSSDVQDTQVLVVVSQIGLVAVAQSALVTHSTQVLLAQIFGEAQAG